MTFRNLLEAEEAIRRGGGDVSYRLDAGLSFDTGTPLLGTLRVPFEHEGNIPVQKLLRQNWSAILTSSEARRLAVQQVEDMVKGMLKATGSTVGLPDLRAGNVLEIDGLGDCFSGRYFVTGTTHSIGDGGYTTQFDCRLEALTGDRRGRA